MQSLPCKTTLTFPCPNRHPLALPYFRFVISIMKYPFGPKTSQIGGGHQKAISKIILSKSDFTEKKRAFIKFTDKYSHENRTFLTKIINRVAQVSDKIPTSIRDWCVESLRKFENGQWKFDEKTIGQIGESFDKVTDEEGLFWALEVKTHIDKFVLKLLREMFYNPIAEKEKLTDDEWEAKSAPERYFRMALEYIFPGETVKVEIDADQTVKGEL